MGARGLISPQFFRLDPVVRLADRVINVHRTPLVSHCALHGVLVEEIDVVILKTLLSASQISLIIDK